ncbi:MAG: response regulator [Actinomycetota bacterium]
MPGGPILLVEDEADIQLTVRLTLEMSGYVVVAVASAEDALEALDRITPSVVLLDISLPGMDGWTFLSTLKADGRLDALRVVVVSAHVSEEASRKADAFGAQYLTKPFDVQMLRSLIAKIIGDSGS